ncbi:MAG: PAS domain S-box protein, partial [Elusimicrobiota bacterium]
MRPTIHVLIVEDSEDDARWLTQELSRGYDPVCERVDSKTALERALDRRPWDLVLSDYFLPGFGGLEALKLVLDKTPDIPFILVSGKAGADTAVEAMTAGAHDYVLKHQLARLLPAVERCLKEAEIRRAKREAEDVLRRGQENLRRANEELEGLVRERTAKLSEANERLSGEIIGRMRAQAQRDLFFSLTHDLLAVGGFDGSIKQVNPAWRKTLGYSPKDLLGKPFLQVVHPEDKAGVEEELERLAQGRETVAYEVRLLTADGSYRWTSWNVTPFPSEGILVGVGRDITDRRAAEDARSRLAAIVESSADAVIAQTLDGAVCNWNVSAQLMYGHTLSEALGRRAVDLLSPENPWELSHLLERVKRGELVRHQEAVHLRKDGSRMDVSLSLSPLRDRAGRIIGAAMISRDVTEHKRLREAALHAERLAIMGQMAAGVAHEIKTPMTVILGFTEVLAEEAKKTGASTERLDIIAKQVRRCAGLVNNLLDFSRKGTAATEDFDLNEAARNALALIHPLAQGRNISVA